MRTTSTQQLRKSRLREDLLFVWVRIGMEKMRESRLYASSLAVKPPPPPLALGPKREDGNDATMSIAPLCSRRMCLLSSVDHDDNPGTMPRTDLPRRSKIECKAPPWIPACFSKMTYDMIQNVRCHLVAHYCQKTRDDQVCSWHCMIEHTTIIEDSKASQG